MRFVTSPLFEKNLRKFDAKFQRRVWDKLALLRQDRNHPSLRYKTVQALKHLNPPVKEISINMRGRVTFQEFEDHIYWRNIGGHEILPRKSSA